MATSIHQREELAIVIGMELAEKANVEQALSLTRFLLRAAVTLQQLNEAHVNRPTVLTTAELQKQKRLKVKVREACAEFGIGVEFGLDPRGGSIFLKLPSGRMNDLGGRGWSVPR